MGGSQPALRNAAAIPRLPLARLFKRFQEIIGIDGQFTCGFAFFGSARGAFPARACVIAAVKMTPATTRIAVEAQVNRRQACCGGIR